MATEAHRGHCRRFSNREPSLRELLDDPIVRLMASDRVRVEQVVRHLQTVRRRQTERVKRPRSVISFLLD
jgi:hypothetical protein